MQGGQRKTLAQGPAKLRAGQWQQLKLIVRGDHLEASLDGEALLSADDSALPKAGRVGLWTQGDTLAYFRDLQITPHD